MNKAEAELELRRGTSQAKKIQQQLDGLESQINNLVSVVASGNKSDAILERLNSLEGQREEVEEQLVDLEGTEDNSMTREEISAFVRGLPRRHPKCRASRDKGLSEGRCGFDHCLYP